MARAAISPKENSFRRWQISRRRGVLSRQFAIIGFSFEQMTTDAFREKLSTEMKEFAPESLNEELWKWFLERIYYVHGDFNDSSAYQRLKDQVAAVEKEHNTQGNRFHYLAVAPTFSRLSFASWAKPG